MNTVLNGIWVWLATLATAPAPLYSSFTLVSPKYETMKATVWSHAVSYLCMDWYLSFPYFLNVHGAKEGNLMSEVDWVGSGTNRKVLTVAREEAVCSAKF